MKMHPTQLQEYLRQMLRVLHNQEMRTKSQLTTIKARIQILGISAGTDRATLTGDIPGQGVAYGNDMNRLNEQFQQVSEDLHLCCDMINDAREILDALVAARSHPQAPPKAAQEGAGPTMRVPEVSLADRLRVLRNQRMKYKADLDILIARQKRLSLEEYGHVSRVGDGVADDTNDMCNVSRVGDAVADDTNDMCNVSRVGDAVADHTNDMCNVSRVGDAVADDTNDICNEFCELAETYGRLLEEFRICHGMIEKAEQYLTDFIQGQNER